MWCRVCKSRLPDRHVSVHLGAKVLRRFCSTDCLEEFVVRKLEKKYKEETE